ncbi:malectin domain-containing carbohydrate-binding protein [Dyadobacter sediminis]|nr:malectin domain-containing carbohydrate-binding protein [Dyadobacter sediminis]
MFIGLMVSMQSVAWSTASDVTKKEVKKAITPSLAPCSPISSLTCQEINVPLPYVLNFTGTEGGLTDVNNAGTGFKMADSYSGSRNASDGTPSSPGVIGYEPSRLTIAQGRLTIAANRGLGFTTSNNQINALGVGFQANGKLTFETAIINPFNGTGSEQAGLWAGLNDKTFLKLSVSANKVELRKEVNDVTSSNSPSTNPDQRITSTISGLNNQTVRLRIILDFNTNTAEGFYSTDGITYQNVGATYTSASNPAAINVENMALSGNTMYAGIYASKRNTTFSGSVDYTFENFSVNKQIYPTVSAPYRINAGGIKRTVGTDVYNADDTYAVVPGVVANSSFTLSGVAVPELYYERRLGTKLSYAIPIANGRYTVKLHMVENYHSTVGKRIFDVNLEGKTVLDNLDLFVEGGNKNKVVVIKSLETNIADGALNIDFNASVDNAMVNAIEILPSVSANQPPVITVIENKITPVGSPFTFIVPANTFIDPENDPLTLSATLTDGKPLPSWLTFNASSRTFSGTPVSAAVYPIRLTANDGKSPAVSTEFTITASAMNRAPVVVTAPETQALIAGQLFSFMTGSFSDPDQGDALTYTAALGSGASLPAWLLFDAQTQTFSGTAPQQTASLSVRITATDKAMATASSIFTVTVSAAPVIVACAPISTLPCEEVAVSLPFMLNFDGQEGGLADKNKLGTGFTMADAYSGTRNTADGTASSAQVWGYEPSRLTVANGRLTIQTHKGIGFTTSNNQINALGVGIPSNGKLTFETTVINPFNGTGSEQGGIWAGLNDKTFVKLAVTGNKVEMRKEVNDVSSTASASSNTDQRVTATISGLNTKTVRLRLVVDLVTNKMEGFYSTDGVNYLNAGASYATPAVDIASMSLAGKPLYAGLYATHRNATTSVSFTFDNFSITQDGSTAKLLTFKPTALDFSAVQGQAVTGKSTILSASEGSPAITLSSTAGSWLTLPSASAGTISFGPSNFSTTMAPGIYEAIVTASANGYQPATLLINLTITTPSVTQQQIQVNFQNAGTVPPAGWVRDYGQPLGARTGANQGTGLEYGWRRRSNGTLLDLSGDGASNLGNGRRRSNPDDVLLASLMHMQADDISGEFNGTKIEGYWEIKVPNGSYEVTVTSGDGDIGVYPESHTINVEGVNAIKNFVPSGSAGSSTRFKTGKVQVKVSDGYLTINADGGTNAKINTAVITPVNVSPYLIWSASEYSLAVEKATTSTGKTFSLDLNHSTSQDNLPITLTADYGPGASNWLSFDASHNGNEPNVTFDYKAAMSLAVGTYTATITASAQGYTSASTLVQVTVIASGANQPYVISSTPVNGATNVSVNTASIAANNIYVPIVDGFKGGVDNSTISLNTVKLYKVVGTATAEILGTTQGTGGGDAISFSPRYALEANTKYRFVVTDQVKSYSGAAFKPYEATFTTGSTTTGTTNPVAAEFAPKQVIPGTVGKKYTCLTFGPDGKFYALRLDGVIERFTVDHQTGMLSEQQEIKSLTAKYGLRSSVGLTFDPASTATNLIAWVSHCSAGLTNAPEFDGNISKLTGANLQTEQLVLTKLPRSKADHLVNSIAFGPDGALYFNQGSLSSMGNFDRSWQRDESLLAATVLRLDLKKLTGITLPLDVRTTSNQALINAAPSSSYRMSDGTYNPYASNSPLTIYASGVRNAVDLVWHTNGQLYVPTNGSAAGGNSPASVIGTRRPDGTFYNGPFVDTTGSIKVQNDWLFRVNPLKKVGYYGHPNPLRGEYVANRGYLDNPKYPASQGPDANYRGAAYNFELNKSPNGAIEYKSNTFNGALKGRLLVCRFSGGSDIIVLEPGSKVKSPSVTSASSDDRIYDIVGAQTGSGTEGISGLSGFTNPLDLTEDVETGNLYVIEYNWNNTKGKTSQIVLLKAISTTVQAGIAEVSPSKVVDNDVVGGAAGKPHAITLANIGNSNLTVTGIALSGTDRSQFQLSLAPTATVSSPVTIARGSAVTFNVAFNPTTAGMKTASIQVTSTGNPVQTVILKGLGTSGLSGTNEPSLQMVLDAHDIKVNVGDDNKSTNVIHSNTTTAKAPLLGEEVPVQAFLRASDGPVIIEPLSVFGPQGPSGTVTGFGWYSSGDGNAKTELFTVANSNYQTIDVQINGASSFDPGINSFGFYSRWPYFANRHLYSEDALNTFTGALPHHVRVYPLKDAAGQTVEHAYVIAFEETTSGLDYQDIVVIARNIKPYEASVKELTLSESPMNFTYALGTSAPAAQTVTLSANLGSPAISISKTANSSWLVLPSSPTLGNLSFGINPTGLALGTYNATVTFAADGYTSANLPVTLTVTNGNDAPVLTPIGNKTVAVSQTLSFTATATDDASQTHTYSLIKAPAGATIDAATGVFTWTPAATGTFIFTVKVTDNGSPALSDVEDITVTVSNSPSASAIRINAGGAAFTASGSRQFMGDNYFGGTNRTGTLASSVDILNTTDDVLYRSERSSEAFNYSIPVSNGTMNVVLHFAETWFGAPGGGTGGSGKRRFNVDIEGSRKLTNYDIYAKAGGALRPVVETFTVTVTDGILNINFIVGSVNIPKISAIEVIPQTTTSNTAPVLAAIGNKTVTVGQAMSFTATATDANAGQSKTFSLVNSPSGAAINATTGVFTWTPSTTGTYTFAVKVTDNGSPVLSDDETITVTVNGTASTSATLSPLADSYVRNGSYAGANYGSATSLVVKSGSGDGITRSAYLKFSLSNVSQVNSAKLRIYGSNTENTTTVNLSAYGVDNDSWTEGGINLNNAPASSSTVLGLVGVTNTKKYYEIDVTAYVQAQLAADKVVSIALKNPSNQNRNLTFNSRENTSNKPQLLITGTVNSGARTSAEEIWSLESKAAFENSTIYPNPIQKRFTVEISRQHAGNVSLELINPNGRSFDIRTPKQITAGSKADIDVSDLSLSSGIYLIRIQSAAATETLKVLVTD